MFRVYFTYIPKKIYVVTKSKQVSLTSFTTIYRLIIIHTASADGIWLRTAPNFNMFLYKVPQCLPA
jgi:hypothetical protein